MIISLLAALALASSAAPAAAVRAASSRGVTLAAPASRPPAAAPAASPAPAQAPAPAAAPVPAPGVPELAAKIAPKVAEWRRDIHRNPELSFKEKRTAALVASVLQEIGVDSLKTDFGGTTGVVAEIKGALPGPTFALRADMDALPIQEPAGAPYASQVPGVMHACGHDAHTAILLGAASVLAGMRDRMAGTVRLIFEPGEETPPGGAAAMVKAGVLDGVAAISGLHTKPAADVGTIDYAEGPAMANADFFKVVVKGQGGHGSQPWLSVNPILAASRIIVGFATVISHEVDPRDPAVLTINQFRAGTAPNVTPPDAEIAGTIRTFSLETQAKVNAAVKRHAEETAQAHRAEALVTIEKGYNAVLNNKELADRLVPALHAAVGADKVTLSKQSFGGESFSMYAERVPGLFFWLGVFSEAIEKTGARRVAHSPFTQVDEAALEIGVRAMSLVALRYLDTVKP